SAVLSTVRCSRRRNREEGAGFVFSCDAPSGGPRCEAQATTRAVSRPLPSAPFSPESHLARWVLRVAPGAPVAPFSPVAPFPRWLRLCLFLLLYRSFRFRQWRLFHQWGR